jgi:ATP-dependent Zn protease
MYYSAERRSTDSEILGKIRVILKEQYSRAEHLVEQNYEKVKQLANALLEKNSLDEEEIITILEGENDEIF